jgi:hypothetical protein
VGGLDSLSRGFAGDFSTAIALGSVDRSLILGIRAYLGAWRKLCNAGADVEAIVFLVLSEDANGRVGRDPGVSGTRVLT